MKSAILASFTLLTLTDSILAFDNLPVFARGDVVLFQGDSITDAARNRADNRSVGHGYASIVASQIGKLVPERKLTLINRGIDGSRVTDLAQRWQTGTLDLNPNFLSILIGINDTLSTVGGQESVETFEQVYDKLLADTLAALPKVKIMLGEPFLLPVNRDSKEYAAEMAELKKRQEVVERLAAKYQLPLVRYQKAFDDACRKFPPRHWSDDGVHPTRAGHELMAEEWLRTANQIGKKDSS